MRIPDAGIDLTERQYKLCEAYIGNGGKKAAAIREAGYSEKAVASKGSRIFDSPNVRAYLRWRRQDIQEVQREFLEKQYPYREIKSTYDYKANVLYTITKDSQDDRIKIAAIAELNKMEGHYAPEKGVHLNIGLDADLEEVKRITSELMGKNKSKY